MEADRQTRLLGQEVEDEPAVTGELADEGARRRVPAQRQRREVDPRGPAFGPAGQVSQSGQFTEQFGMSTLPRLLAAAEPPTVAEGGSLRWRW